MVEDNYDFAYKDISELKSELEGMKGKKEISAKDLAATVEKLASTVTDMLEVFGAAAEQMKLEEKEYEGNTKKHEQIIQKLDKLIDQNRTIAEGMVAIVEMVKEKIIDTKEPKKEELRPERWQPRPEIRRQAPMQQQTQMPQIPPPSPNPIPGTMISGVAQQRPQQQIPPIAAPANYNDLDIPPPSSSDMDFDFNLDEEPKKKSLFGMFKK